MIRSCANADGTQTIEDTGPLTRARMETVDEEVTAEALAFMDKAHADGKPFFVWWNSTRMHIFTHLKPASEGVTGQGIYADGMFEHDGQVGQLLDKLDELGIADNTIVMYSTDNGAETFSWPDGGTTMFRGEKNTNWEGGYRVPTLIRWPGVIEPGTVVNEVGAHEDMLTTLLAAAGEPDIKQDLLQGKQSATAPTRFISTATTSGRRSRAKRTGRGTSSSTGPTTAASPRCVTTTGRSPSCGRRPRALPSGRTPSRSCGRRCWATCAWTPSSGPRGSTPWAMTAGMSTMRS